MKISSLGSDIECVRDAPPLPDEVPDDSNFCGGCLATTFFPGFIDFGRRGLVPILGKVPPGGPKVLQRQKDMNSLFLLCKVSREERCTQCFVRVCLTCNILQVRLDYLFPI